MFSKVLCMYNKEKESICIDKPEAGARQERQRKVVVRSGTHVLSLKEMAWYKNMSKKARQAGMVGRGRHERMVGRQSKRQERARAEDKQAHIGRQHMHAC